jgi:Protein of unknown function (DUF3592)
MLAMGFFRLITAIFVIFLPIAVVVGWLMWQMRRQEQAKDWPATEATIQSAELEVVQHSRYGSTQLPVCAFSYQVSGEYYSGRFSLLPNNGAAADFPVEALVDRKLPIHYEPKRPGNWYIPLENFDGCELEQKLSPHLVRLFPKD